MAVWKSCWCRRRQFTEKLMLKRNRNEWAELMGILSAFSNAEFSWSKLSAGCNVRAMHRRKCFKCTVVFCRLTILFYFSTFSFDFPFIIWSVWLFNWHDCGSEANRKLILSEVFIKYKISGKNWNFLVAFINSLLRLGSFWVVNSVIYKQKMDEKVVWCYDQM